MFAVLEREREETKEAESSVTALRRQVAAQREAVAALDADIEQYRARVANLRKGMFPLPTSIVPRMNPLVRARKGTENAGQACSTYICTIACLRAYFVLRD